MWFACASSPKINVGDEPDGSVAGSGGASGASGFGGVGGFGGGDNTLTALITEPPSEMAIEVITVSCAGECRQVLAIATGGNAPYSFQWNDGVSGDSREICADDDTTFTVTANDTEIIDGEFPYAGQTASASVTMDVLACPADGGVDAGPGGTLCIHNPSFEGTPGITEAVGFTAPPWQMCTISPDIWDENQGWNLMPNGLAASDGSTYLSMVHLAANIRESAGQALCAPLVAGHTYSFQIGFAFRVQGGFGGGEPGSFQVWAGNSVCAEDQLLFTSLIPTADWQTACATFTADDDYGYVLVVPTLVAGGSTGAFVDNIVPVDHCP
jgi:hypothetical protein